MMNVSFMNGDRYKNDDGEINTNLNDNQNDKVQHQKNTSNRLEETIYNRPLDTMKYKDKKDTYNSDLEHEIKHHYVPSPDARQSNIHIQIEMDNINNQHNKTISLTPCTSSIRSPESYERCRKLPSISSSFSKPGKFRSLLCGSRAEPEHELSTEDRRRLEWIEQQFKKKSGKNGNITLANFKKALGAKKAYFAERVFTLFDTNNSNTIELHELMAGAELLLRGSPNDKLKFLFDLMDTDGNGSIDRNELKTAITACMEESSLSFGNDKLEALTDILFESADDDCSDTLSFEELANEFNKYPGILENLTMSGLQWLSPPKPKKTENCWSRYFSLKYLKNNSVRVVYLAIYLLLNVVLGVYAGWTYRKSNVFIIIARICGINLNFNCTFICVPMLKMLLTKSRERRISEYLPLDSFLGAHKMIAFFIAIYSVVHTLAHIGNVILVSMETDALEVWEILFTTKANIGWVKGSAFITGWILLSLFIVLYIFAMPCFRRSGYFELFYFTHMMYIPIWVCLILHGPHFWKWFIVPGVLFIIEKLIRTKIIQSARLGNIYIKEVNLLPAGVIHLVIKRPDNFKYKPGDYCFLNIPDISKYEWHPFTISSAPELEDEIWFHIRSVGSWTFKLYQYFDKYEYTNHFHLYRFKKLQSMKDPNVRVDHTEKQKHKSLNLRRLKERNKKLKVQCFLDGPYGTGTREIFETEHAVLIGTGIGVTPMASILQSIASRYKTSMRACPECAHTWFQEMPKSLMRLKKVDFIWLNRAQKSFEWFISLLTEIEMDQALMESSLNPNLYHFIDMHMYITSAKQKTDMNGLFLQIALDLMRSKENKDLITGLQSKTEAGRPNWNKLFGKIAAEKKGRVKVFFCGAPALAKVVKKHCETYKFGFVKEQF